MISVRQYLQVGKDAVKMFLSPFAKIIVKAHWMSLNDSLTGSERARPLAIRQRPVPVCMLAKDLLIIQPPS